MALTTLTAVKTYLGDALDSSSDVELTRLLDAASSWFESATGVTFGQTTYTNEKQNGPQFRSKTSILPKNTPVTSVTSVAVDGVTIPAQTTVGGNGWVLVDDVIYLVGYSVPPGVGNVSLTYVAGYATIPADVQQAVIEIVAWWFRGKEHTGLFSKSTAGGGYTQFASGGTPPSVDPVVESYRVVSLG